MKIYVVMDNNWQDYEGGGGEIAAVKSTRDKAVDFIVETYSADYVQKDKDNLDRWDTRKETPAQECWISIEEWDID